MQDIAGVRFGRLTAIAETRRLSRDGSPFWLCRCRCGASTAASRASLELGKTLSCGCDRRIGRRYGWLTVADVTGENYLCRCACGREITLDRKALETAKSCGCAGESRAVLDGQVCLFPASNGVPCED